MSIAYSDGSEEEVLRILQEAPDVSSTSIAAHDRYVEWPIRYHLCPERSNLLRHLEFAGLDVLELGAGMGGASRFIAENARSFVGVEGSRSRAAGLQCRLRDLSNCEVVVSNLQDYVPTRKFDVVCMIGVLEYSELFVEPPSGVSPFEWVLAHAAGMLKPNGRLVLAIENRLGLKYWAGAPEDHTGRLFDGICWYPSGKSPRTFSRRYLLELCNQAGLTVVQEFYPWPDYKTPSSVVSKDLVDRFPQIAADIAADATAHDEQLESANFPWSLAMHGVAVSGLFAEFADSFLFVAGRAGCDPQGGTLLKRTTSECAWHYSLHRRDPVGTVFHLGACDDLLVTKRRLPVAESSSAGPPPYSTVRWSPKQDAPVLAGETVLASMRRAAYADDAATFQSELETFVGWACAEWQRDSDHLHGDALDLTVMHSIPDGAGYVSFDLELVAVEPVAKSWFVLRNLLVARDSMALFNSPPYRTRADLYAAVCSSVGIAPCLEEDIVREARIQCDVHRDMTAEVAKSALRSLFKDRWRPSQLPKDPSVERRRRGIAPRGPSVARRVARLIRSPQALARAVKRRAARAARAVSVLITRGT